LHIVVTHPAHSPWWLAAWLAVAAVAAWWCWPSADDAVSTVPVDPVASVATPPVAQTTAIAATSVPAVAKPAHAAPSASPFKLVGTVRAANNADSFALLRRTADSQLVRLRTGDRIEGYTVRRIESDSVVLAGVAHTIVVEADSTAATDGTAAATRSTVPLPVVSRAPASQEEPAWAGDPAPFGH
jgi:type II secretory pathway component PulC